jgi:phenylacetate-CoA ligase
VSATALAQLGRALARAAATSAFWRARLRDWEPGEAPVRMDEFSRLPLLEKKTLLADQLEHPPFGSLLAVERHKLRRIHRTTGTSAAPLLVLLTDSDVATAVEAGARAFRCSGVEPSDIVVHCLNYCMWSGGVTDHQCLEAAGATVIPFGVGNSHFLIDVIRRVRPTALSCTPSYLVRLRDVLAEMGLVPADLGLKKAFCGGEGGLQDAGFRSAIEAEWKLRAIDANYGLSDVLSIIASECDARDGLHFHAHDIVLPELVDAGGAPVAIAKGASGELVLSTLVREAQPLFRYRTNDMVRIVDTARCACGRDGLRFQVIGRSDDMVTVKGVNFFASALQGFVATLPQLSGEYRVVAPRPPIQEIVLELEMARNAGEGDWEGLAATIARHVSRVHSVKVTVAFVDHGALARSEDKTRRLVRG